MTTTTAPADPYAAHRQDLWAFIDNHGVPGVRDIVMRLGEHWATVTARWFPGQMTRPTILLACPAKSSAFGDTANIGSYGEPVEIRIRPSIIDGTHPKVNGPQEGCWRFAEDVLLHESIHQWQFEVSGNSEDSYHGHGPQFTAHCNRIGTDLGLPSVVTRNRKGSKNPRSAQWPHNVRPPGYYLGAYDPEGGTADPGEETEPADPPDMIKCPHCGGRGKVPSPAAPRDPEHGPADRDPEPAADPPADDTCEECGNIIDFGSLAREGYCSHCGWDEEGCIDLGCPCPEDDEETP